MKTSIIIYKNGIKINADANVKKLKIVTLVIYGLSVIEDVK